MSSVSVSIAMATLNGARFLESQLASIAAQTRNPTEMVVCDDGSVDETVAIVERFASSAPYDVHLIRNERRLGYGENFMKAARLCRGDAIAWCDQDDMWMPNKLARCAEEFENDRDVLLVVHARRIGEWVHRGQPVIRGASHREEHTPTSLPFWISAPGYACVLSRRVLEIGDALAARLPGVFDRFSGHDTWTTFLAGAIGKVVLIPDVLVQYRQHTEQVAGAPPPQTATSRVKSSAQRSQSQIELDLEPQIPRAFFRASLLAQLAEHLDGIERGLGHGAVRRSEMWRRHAETLERRRDLWRQRPASARGVARLCRSVSSGDYRHRDRGGLGLASLARDTWRAVNPAGRGRA